MSDAKIDSRLERAKKFLGREFRRRPRTVEVAAHVGLSPFHFHRAFAREVGCTPRDYLDGLALNAAKKDLAESAKPLEKIAGDLGFVHQSHFTVWFRKQVGIPPGAYRTASKSLRGKPGKPQRKPEKARSRL